MGYHHERLFAFRLPYLWWFLCGGLTVLNICPSEGYNIHISESMVGRRVRRSTHNSNPVFAQQQYSGSVSENENPGYIIDTIVATDSDSGPAGEITYSMEAYADVRSISKFTIGPTDGIVRTLETLDREFIPEHKFRIVATDSGDPPGSAMTILTITVLDKNDHTPEFELRDYHEQVEEGLVAGTTVATVHATDGDDGSNSEITYQILNPEPPNDVFTIQNSGAITTSKKLDRETIETYTLHIQASDNGNPSHSSTAVVIITVLDVNDNSPQFSHRNYEVSVEENSGQNQVLVHISATDKDLSRNQEIRYSLYSGNDQGLFMIDSLNGDLSLIRELDYEMKKTHRLVVKAVDSGAQSLSNTTNVIVNVIDVNDNAPAFTGNLYQTAVSENVNVGHQVREINAFDQDSGENGRLTYNIENVDPNFPFTIDVVGGRVFITTSSELDRETKDEYRFSVRVADNGDPQLSATTSVIIRVTDVNDNPPTFPERWYYTVVDEGAGYGTHVITIAAEDPDFDNYVSYQITAGNLRDRFSIRTRENQGQIIVFQSLDYNQERRFALTIEATDGQLSDTCTVFINVSDANTYAPEFTQEPYRVNVPEDVPIGYTVVRVTATDGDNGKNARIEYSMDLEQTFEVDPVTGDVKTKLLLDRETLTSYSLRIKASDHGNPVKQKFTNVEITVTDVNDNDPVFQLDSYSAEILENVNSRHSVIQISASDKDEGTFGAVTYTFEGGNDGDGKFAIESSSGIIRTCADCRLDREEVPVYNLVAIAKDGGGRETSVPVLVTLLDVNDNSPSFGTNELEMHIPENSDVGSIVGIVQATDADTGSNAIITYEIVYQGVENLFLLDAYTGELTTNGYLDYEARNSYTLSIKAISEPFFTTVFLTVYVEDVNPSTKASDYGNPVKEGFTNVIALTDVEQTATSVDAFTLRNQNMSIKTTLSPLTDASTPLKDEDRDVTKIPAVTAIKPVVSPAKLEYTNITTATQMILDKQTLPAAYQETIIPVTEQLTKNITSTTVAPVGVNAKNITTQFHARSQCSCDRYNDEERDLTMKILQVKLETQETQLTVRKMERHVANMKLRYWTQLVKFAEERQIDFYVN